jgi:hypothetical protein
MGLYTHTHEQGNILLVADSGSHVVRLFECDDRGEAGDEACGDEACGVEADQTCPVRVKPMGVSLGGYGLGNGRMRFPFSLAARDDGTRRG